MSSSLATCLTSFSKDIGDDWQSTTTGAGSATTMVDTALMAKSNDWIPLYNAWVFLLEEPTGNAVIYDERLTTALDNTTGTLTTLTFAAAPGTGIDYSLHRLFSPSDKRTALIYACKAGFPYIHKKIRNEAKRAGNWLKDGSFEEWSGTSALSNWTASGTTLTQTSTARLFLHGSYSCKLNGAAGYVGQSIANNDDLKLLRGRTVKLIGRGWSDTASSLRMSIYDGTTTTYSAYHPGNSAWDDEDDTWYVEATISSTATEVAFRLYHDVAAATEYVDDFRVLAGNYPKVYINDFDIALDKPHQVSWQYDTSKEWEPWIPLRKYQITPDWLYLDDVPVDARLRIEGIGYLDFLASGVSSTAWTATVDLDEPQTKILYAEAASYLYRQMMLPGNTTGSIESYTMGYQIWQQELQDRRVKYGMVIPAIRTKWTV